MFSRFEEFLDNTITLTKEHIRQPEISRSIASQLRVIHSVQTEGQPGLWTRLERWINTYKKLGASEGDLVFFQSSVDFIKQKLIPLNSPIVFAHGDVTLFCLFHARHNTAT